MTEMLFSGWSGVVRVIVVGTLSYAGLLLLLRATGKRTLSKLNAFDLVVTVALGSTLATVLLSRDVALAEGLTAFALLVALQWIVTWLSVRSSRVTRFVKSEPRLVYFQGDFLSAAMQAERLTEDELRSAARAQGVRDMEDIAGIVLESDGSLSVIGPGRSVGESTLEGVVGAGSSCEVPRAGNERRDPAASVASKKV